MGVIILGNFLSGMETDVTEDEDVGTGALGNFLSGMETLRTSTISLPERAPWKLP